MSVTDSQSYWQRHRLNLGLWRGSFTHLDATTARFIDEDPSLLHLEATEDGGSARLTLTFFESVGGAVRRERVWEYNSLARGVVFFPGGEFCQGSMQVAPYSDFGVEYGFIHGNRRLRLVQLYNPNHQPHKLTLIREHREEAPEPESPPLTVEALEGEWRGESLTLYTDGRLPASATTSLTVHREGDEITQHLRSGEFELRSSALIEGCRLLFTGGSQPIQVLLLPGGASCTGPIEHEWGRPLYLEAGWMIQPGLRHRLIRSFNIKGEWESTTLIIERRF